MRAVLPITPAALPTNGQLLVAISRDFAAIHADWRRDTLVQAGLFALVFLFSTLSLRAFQKRQREQEQLIAGAGEALAKRERFIAMVTDSIPGMVAYWNSDLRCEYANHAYLDWFGKTPGQMWGMAIQALLGESLFA